MSAPSIDAIEAACKAHWDALAVDAPPRAGIVPWDKVGPDTKTICRQAMLLALMAAATRQDSGT